MTQIKNKGGELGDVRALDLEILVRMEKACKAGG